MLVVILVTALIGSSIGFQRSGFLGVQVSDVVRIPQISHFKSFSSEILQD